MRVVRYFHISWATSGYNIVYDINKKKRDKKKIVNSLYIKWVSLGGGDSFDLTLTILNLSSQSLVLHYLTQHSVSFVTFALYLSQKELQSRL